jgi:hypothetical protein
VMSCLWLKSGEHSRTHIDLLPCVAAVVNWMVVHRYVQAKVLIVGVTRGAAHPGRHGLHMTSSNEVLISIDSRSRHVGMMNEVNK